MRTLRVCGALRMREGHTYIIIGHFLREIRFVLYRVYTETRKVFSPESFRYTVLYVLRARVTCVHMRMRTRLIAYCTCCTCIYVRM